MDDLINMMNTSSIKTNEENWDELIIVIEKFEKISKNYRNISSHELFLFFSEIDVLFKRYKINFIDDILDNTLEFNFRLQIQENCNIYISEFESFKILQNYENICKLLQYGYNTVKFIEKSVNEHHERKFHEDEEHLDKLNEMDQEMDLCI